MRATSTKTEHGFEAKAISGIHTILIALNCPDAARKGLKGFAFEREMVGPNSKGPKFLRSQKVFKSVVPDPKNAHDPNSPTKPAAFYTDKFPVQSFLLGRLRSGPRHHLSVPVSPMFGTPGALTTAPEGRDHGSRSRPRRNGAGRVTACGSTAAPSRARTSPRSSATSQPQDINNPDDPRTGQNGCRAACSRPA